VPILLINAAVSKDQAVFGQFKRTSDESIGKFAWFNRERADIASQLF
jgi:hypothetical protein